MNYRTLVLIVFSAVLFPFCFLNQNLSYLAWITLIPLFWGLEGSGPRNAFKYGAIFGTVLSYIGLYWLVGTLTRFGGFPVVISIFFILIFCIYSSIQFALFSYLTVKFKLLKKSTIESSLTVAAVWVFLEYFFPQLFPYGIGNSQGLNITIIQIVDLLGVSLLSFAIVFVNLSLYKLIRSLKRRSYLPLYELSVSLLIILFIVVYGTYKIRAETENINSAEKIKVGLVQANFDFFEKNEGNEDFVTDKHKQMSYSISDSDLLLWPETAVQGWLSLDSEHYIVNEKKVVPDIKNTYFLIGGLSYKIEDKGNNKVSVDRFNSAILTDWNGKILGHFHKIKLLMFGEYLPLSNLFPSIKKFSPATGDYTPGSNVELLSIPSKGIRIGTLICYEDILPFFSREYVKKGANIIINLTNDAWFGRSTAPFQHLLVSLPRAVENRRYLIRATNTGVSAIIDSTGRVVKKSEIFEDTSLVEKISLLENQPTLYTRVGDIFPWLCFIVFIIYIFKQHLRRKYS